MFSGHYYSILFQSFKIILKFLYRIQASIVKASNLEYIFPLKYYFDTVNYVLLQWVSEWTTQQCKNPRGSHHFNFSSRISKVVSENKKWHMCLEFNFLFHVKMIYWGILCSTLQVWLKTISTVRMKSSEVWYGCPWNLPISFQTVLHLRNVYSHGIVNPIYLTSLASMSSMDLMDCFFFLKKTILCPIITIVNVTICLVSCDNISPLMNQKWEGGLSYYFPHIYSPGDDKKSKY